MKTTTPALALILLLLICGCRTTPTEPIPPHVVKVTQLPSFDNERKAFEWCQYDLRNMKNYLGYVIEHHLHTNEVDITSWYKYEGPNYEIKVDSKIGKNHTAATPHFLYFITIKK